MENQKVEPEPERIGPIAERVLKDIEQRRQRRCGVIEAVKDFLSGQRNPAKGHTLKVRTKHVRE